MSNDLSLRRPRPDDKAVAIVNSAKRVKVGSGAENGPVQVLFPPEACRIRARTILLQHLPSVLVEMVLDHYVEDWSQMLEQAQACLRPGDPEHEVARSKAIIKTLTGIFQRAMHGWGMSAEDVIEGGLGQALADSTRRACPDLLLAGAAGLDSLRVQYAIAFSRIPRKSLYPDLLVYQFYPDPFLRGSDELDDDGMAEDARRAAFEIIMDEHDGRVSPGPQSKFRCEGGLGLRAMRVFEDEDDEEYTLKVVCCVVHDNAPRPSGDDWAKFIFPADELEVRFLEPAPSSLKPA